MVENGPHWLSQVSPDIPTQIGSYGTYKIYFECMKQFKLIESRTH